MPSKISGELYKVWPYLLIISVLTLLFYGIGFDRNWSFWADQELTLGYNGLLINSGFNQEYIDHPGFFSIQLIAFLQKIANWLGLAHLQTIDGFNQSESLFDSMRYLVITARHAALVTTIALVSFTYYVSQKLTQNVRMSLLVACLVFVSNGVFYHFTATRTEAIAFAFLLLALYFFIESFKAISAPAPFRLLLALIFFFCGALNKAQILVLAPFYFCWASYFINPDQNSKQAVGLPQWLYALLAPLSYLGLLYFYSLQSSGKGFLFNCALVTFFNGLLLLICFCRKKINHYKALSLFNIGYWLAYYLTNALSTWVNEGVSIFGNIADPMSMSRYLFISGGSQILNPQSNLIASPSLGDKLQAASIFFLSPLVETFGKISSSTLLIIFCTIWMFLKRDQLSKKEFWFGIFCFVSFYIVNLVNKSRYFDAPQYRIFSEFFLLTYALLLISKMTKTLQFKVLGGLIFLTVLANLVPYTHYYNWLIRKGSHPFCHSEVVHTHVQMSETRIAEACAQPGPEH
ncbi:hypothetical protein [Polynucleobacter paneuropaeus]|uniref:hypothetical protein n=1 Tax=Polynucleobacter paneuropaeus TaxID=2527775 RepID=UPI001BFD21CC|nr:hypothetical protein [Polynucleobacter paneuropaeus]MBT8621931.1 hypothetical protein [Polynucleobacter paneuropaeus]